MYTGKNKKNNNEIIKHASNEGKCIKRENGIHTQTIACEQKDIHPDVVSLCSIVYIPN